MYFLHTELFISERGAIIMGWSGIGLFVLSLTGIVVWWPRKGQLACCLFSGARARHDVPVISCIALRLAGIAFLCIISVSGVALVFPEITDTSTRKRVSKAARCKSPHRGRSNECPMSRWTLPSRVRNRLCLARA
jgi:uncharacterized iron-regulated membrane protein